MGDGLCKDCGARFADGQSYCLSCGSRVGARSPQLLGLLRGFERPSAAEKAPATPAAPLAVAAPPESGIRLPRPGVSALLVLAFVGFGMLLGNAASSSLNTSLAASLRPGQKLAAAPPAATSTTSSTPAPAPSEPPSAEATPTPGGGSAEAGGARGSSKAAKTPANATEGTPESPASGGGEGAGAGSESNGAGAGAPAKKLPALKHVFVIMLSSQPFAGAFGPTSTAHYLSRTLEAHGELLVRYDAVAHEQLANGIALLSGQGATAQSAANCPNYSDLTPFSAGAEQQILGDGCVYPSATQTLPGQLALRHLASRAYIQGIGEGPGQPAACGHPALGAADPTTAGTPGGSPYATFRNPFLYFHSIIDAPSCASTDVGLDRLRADLSSPARTPAFSYIVPDRCHDGSTTPCAAGAPAGMPAADGLLKRIVPQILASKAYRDGGLLVITVDEAPSSGESADSSSCCGEPRFPNLPAGRSLLGHGGGTVGALLLSRYVKAATVSQEPFNHFSLLRTIEDLFHLKHLGYAGAPGARSFEPAMFTAAPH